MDLPAGVIYQEGKIQTGENFHRMQDEVSRSSGWQCTMAKQREQPGGASAEEGDIQGPERLHGDAGVGEDLERE